VESYRGFLLPFLSQTLNSAKKAKEGNIIQDASRRLKLMNCNAQVSTGSTEKGFQSRQPQGWGRENNQMQIAGKC